MSDFNNIPIRDFNGVEQDVGGKIIDSVFHASSLPVNGIIAETADFTISSTPTDIALIGVENFMLIDLGTNDTTNIIYFEIQYRTAGDWILVEPMPVAPFSVLPQINGNAAAGINLRWVADTGSRVAYLPCLGAVAMRIRMSSGTLAGVRVKHLVGVPPYVQAITKTQRSVMGCYLFPTFTTSYASGDVVGGTLSLESQQLTSAIERFSAPRILNFAFSDNGRGIGDHDVVICQTDENTPLADSDAFALDSGYSVLGWYEFRAAPTGDQLPLRDFGAGIKGSFVPEMSLQAEYTNEDAGSLYLADVFIVSRAAITPTAGSSIARLMVEF